MKYKSVDFVSKSDIIIDQSCACSNLIIFYLNESVRANLISYYTIIYANLISYGTVFNC